METIPALFFWLSGLAVFHTYIGYPLVLRTIRAARSRAPGQTVYEPKISIIIPVHNERAIIREKIENTLSLDYPENKREVLIISDGSTDGTGEVVRDYLDRGVRYHELAGRNGKAAALNAGLQEASGSLIFFSDASILIAKDAIRSMVARFSDERIGCVSGEDSIEGPGNEGLYGKYEILVRNLESRAHSIVGASGCFYAQRKSLCPPFPPGLAPDFFSVLVAVRNGFRAVTDPGARGVMKEVRDARASFDRKVRTFLRGITTLMQFKDLLNPLRHGFFSFQLLSHKLLRWTTGVFLLAALLSNIFLLQYGVFYRFTMLLQLCFYTLALLGLAGMRHCCARVPLFFIMVNFSSLVAWLKYFAGFRQEVWEPSRR